MVEAAKHLPPGKILPFVKVIVSKDGLSFKELGNTPFFSPYCSYKNTYQIIFCLT